ncbi:MAG: DNA primase [Planctomycetes bacterium]|nr:DNA primase [Planctomycetota bacterium]
MGRISQDSIRRIREANDIADLIGSYLQLKRAGSALKGLCPFHNEKTPSFTVNHQRQTYKCFGCGAGGSVIDFLMEYEKLDFVEALQRLAERGGVTIEYDGGDAPDPNAMRANRDRKQLLYDAMDWGRKLFMRSLVQQNDDAKAAREYLKSRGFTKSRCEAWGIGYAPDAFDYLLKHAVKDFGDSSLLDECGLTRTNERGNRYDFFRGRITFPIRDVQGRVVAFGARKMKESDEGGKYINSPTTPIYDKSRVLYGIDRLPSSQYNRARERGKKLVVVVEGYFDVIACHDNGIDCAVAPCGTAITGDQLRTLGRFGDKIILLMDGDAAGQASMERVTEEVITQGLNVSAAMLPKGKDPDDFFREHEASDFERVLANARDLFSFKLDTLARRHDLQHPAGMRAALDEAIQTIVATDDELLRDNLLKRSADYFRVSERDLHRAWLETKRRQRQPAAEGQRVTSNHAIDLGERTLLLRLLTHPELLAPVGSFVFPEDFRSREAAEIYRAIHNANDEDGCVDGASVLDHLDPSRTSARRLLADLLEGDLSVKAYEEREVREGEENFDLASTVERIRAWHERRGGVVARIEDPATRLDQLRQRKKKQKS